MRILNPSLAVLCGAFALFPMSLPGQDGVGLVVEARTTVHVFDPDTEQITATITIPIPTALNLIDVVIAPDLSEAYVSDPVAFQIWVLDLTKNPPALADGVNPIVPSDRPFDLDLTPDGRFLLADTGNRTGAGGGSLSVINVRSRTQVSSVPFHPGSPNAVSVAPDGSVLVFECMPSPDCAVGNVLRYRIDENGNLTPTGDSINLDEVGGVLNMLVPSYPHLPGFLNRFLSRHTLHISSAGGMTFGSLRNDGLTPVDRLTTAYPTGLDIAFDPLRSLAYARSRDGLLGPPSPGDSQIEGYFFNPLTGSIGPRIVSIALDRRAGTLQSIDQMAVDPRSRKLFVSGMLGEVRVFDSITGTHLGSMTAPGLVGVTRGVAVRRAAKKWPWH